MKSNQLPVNEYADYYKSYIQVLEDVELIEEMEICLHEFIKFVQNISMDKFDYQYAEGKWTIKEIIQHLIDSERVFSYRALRISRNDKTPLPGFDENDYARESESSYDKKALIEEFLNARKASSMLFNSFKEEWVNTKVGKTDLGDYISLLSLGHIIIGHWMHHKKVLIEKYCINF
jgi:hypothetical protein